MIFIYILAAAVLAVLGLAARKPSAFRYARTARIKAPAEAIFPLINDFRAWESWSPFEKLDPALKRTYSGPAAGKGATYAWDGNAKAGGGVMEITESTAPSKIVIRLDFIKPFKAVNTGEFTLLAQGDATEVTWAMRGNYGFLSKVMCVFINLDKMVGKSFEEGLANLKVQTEK